MADSKKVAPVVTEGGSQTLARGLVALTMIGEAERPLSVPQLAEALGIHRSMAYRLVKTLEQQGFIERTPAGKLELSLRVAALARGIARDLQSAAIPHLTKIANRFGVTAFLTVYDGESVVNLTDVEPVHAKTTVAQRLGTRHAIDRGAPGHVIRSQLYPQKYPPRRYETSNDEVLAGIASIAVPLNLPGGRPAGIAVLYVPQPVPEEEIVEALISASASITAEMH